MRNSTVSVIIPCYNSISTIDRAINSVINQTFKCTEIIIIDDCSSDETYAHLLNLKEEIKPRIHIILERNEENMGPSFSRNRGLKLATGSWIAFLDSDDHWHPQKIEIQISVAEKFSIFFVGTKSRVSTSTETKKINTDQIKTVILTKKNFYWKNYFQTPSVFVKRSELLIFDESMKYSEDFNLWMELMDHYKRAILIENELVFLGKPPFRGSGLSQNLYLMERGELYVLSKIPGLFLRYGSMFFSLIKFFKRMIIVTIKKL
jgi:glycosyltransferase involved in cell wall biosynthesis